MTQRKTQTAAYWQNQFTVSSKDIEYLYNQVLETGKPLPFAEIAIALVKRHCDAEELATRSELQRGELYHPKNSYAVGDAIIFPALDFALGTVTQTRPGSHIEYGQFTVLGVTIEGEPELREFAANFARPDVLNINEEQSLSNIQGLLTPEELYRAYQPAIQAKVGATLTAHNDFVEFHDRYFLRDMLTNFHEGLFNIADAAIDIDNKPLNVDTLITHMGLAAEADITDTLRFSVNYRLSQAGRFNDVGPKGQVCWYLERLQPPEAYQMPRYLRSSGNSYDAALFDEEFLPILADIDDETTHPDDIPATPPETDRITVVLTYPHWRAGSLPLTPKTLPFFPISYHNPVMFEFVDGRTGDSFAGWTVLDGNYVFGLEAWFRKNKIPVGACLTLKRTKDPMRIIIDYQSTRAQRDWIRVANVVNRRLTFQMNTQAISCKYDDLMIIGDPNPAAIDQLGQESQEKKLPLYDILCRLFPELSKLNPQSTVHFKTLYSAVNMIRRFSPGVIYEELNRHECFVPMNHGYWTFDPTLQN